MPLSGPMGSRYTAAVPPVRRLAFSFRSRSSLRAKPTEEPFTWPFLKYSRAGMLLMPKDEASSGARSTFSLTILTFPAYFSESSCITGASIRQGPHHSAKKSTRTGSSDWRTS